MKKVFERILENHAKHARRSARGLEVAKANKNYQLAVFNSDQMVKCFLMQGLLTWRQGNDPREFLKEAVNCCKEGWAVMQSISAGEEKISAAPFEKVAFLAYLLGTEFSIPSTDDLQADRLLDAVLAGALAGQWDAEAWNRGMRELQKVGSPLAVTTYNLYQRIVTSETSETESLLRKGEGLFLQRKKDVFFSGGDQTEGGGPDNDFTVDYRLAALGKLKGCTGEKFHAWRW